MLARRMMKKASTISFTPTTWDPNNKSSHITLSNGNLTVATDSASAYGVRSVFSASTGKYYWEILVSTVGDDWVGICTSSYDFSSYLGYDSYSWGFRLTYPTKWPGNIAWGSQVASSERLMVALDVTNGKIWVGKQGTWFNSGDPAAGTNPMFSGLSGTFYAACSLGNLTPAASHTANFGGSAFTYSVPSGFTSGFGS